MIIIIAVSNMVASLSTDMYLPALPTMSGYFHTSAKIMNLTLVGFFFFFAIGMLLFGPVSDKLGRKKILLTGVAIYGIASVGCALATSVEFLIFARVIEALGGGCMVAVTTALVKDQFSGNSQGTILAVAQVLGVVSPVLAPIIGAQLFRFFGWQSAFVVLAAISLMIFILCSLMAETLPVERRLTDKLIKSFTRLGVVMKNKKFTIFLISMITPQIGMMAYISTSSYIYETSFGLSTTAYSFFFAATALASVLGPIIYVFLRKKNVFTLSYWMFGFSIACGLVILVFGHRSPYVFAIAFAPFMMMAAASRPFSTTILLNQQKEDSGSASSLINFANSLTGTVGMAIITMIWTDYIKGIGILIVALAIFGFILCLILMKSYGRDSLTPKIY